MTLSLRKKRNLAFLQIRKKKIGVIAILEEEKIRQKIKNYVLPLSPPEGDKEGGNISSLPITPKVIYNNLYELVEKLNNL